MKIDCDKLALEAIRFASLDPARAPGLAELFRVVEREAFCDGVRTGRMSSFAADPQELYISEYAPNAPVEAHRKAAASTRRRRQAKAPQAERPDGEHREEAPPEPTPEIAVRPSPGEDERT